MSVHRAVHGGMDGCGVEGVLMCCYTTWIGGWRGEEDWWAWTWSLGGPWFGGDEVIYRLPL